MEKNYKMEKLMKLFEDIYEYQGEDEVDKNRLKISGIKEIVSYSLKYF